MSGLRPETLMTREPIASVPPAFTHNPKHEIGTCGTCGEEMVWNVPRLGPNGGFIHKSTGQFMCATGKTSGLCPFCEERAEIEYSSIGTSIDCIDGCHVSIVLPCFPEEAANFLEKHLKRNQGVESSQDKHPSDSGPLGNHSICSASGTEGKKKED